MADRRTRAALVPLDDRVKELREWATSRIEECRRQEEKFGGALWLRVKSRTQPPQALVEAWTERRALQAALRILEDEG